MAASIDPRERLRQLIFPKTNKSLPEVTEFREAAQVALRLGGINGLDEWISARLELGLIQDIAVKRLVVDITRTIGRILQQRLDAEMNRRRDAMPKQITWEERRKQLNKREAEARQNCRPVGCRTTLRNPPPTPGRRLSLKERMAAGFEQNVQRDVP